MSITAVKDSKTKVEFDELIHSEAASFPVKYPIIVRYEFWFVTWLAPDIV